MNLLWLTVFILCLISALLALFRYFCHRSDHIAMDRLLIRQALEVAVFNPAMLRYLPEQVQRYSCYTIAPGTPFALGHLPDRPVRG